MQHQIHNTPEGAAAASRDAFPAATEHHEPLRELAREAEIRERERQIRGAQSYDILCRRLEGYGVPGRRSVDGEEE